MGCRRAGWSRGSLRYQLLAWMIAAASTGCGRKTPEPAASPAASTPPIRYVDATREAGIDFRHTHGGSGGKLMPETVGSGVAWLDYDGDDHQDLLLVNCGPLPGTRAKGRPTAALYRNLGDGRFEDRTLGSGLDVVLYGQGATAADYDADGDVDVFITCVGSNHLFRNDTARGAPRPRFQDVTQRAGVGDGARAWRWHTGSAWLDYDRDGGLDLFVARYVEWTPQADQFCGIPGGIKRYCPPWKYTGERCALYRNRRDGTFEDVSGKSGVDRVIGKWFQPVVLDDNADGWPDVAVASDGTPTALFRNLGGKFTDAAAETGLGVSETGMPKGQMGIDAADWRNQGKESLLIGNFSGQRLSMFDPDTSGLFGDVADRVGMGESSLYSLTFGVAFLDADLDGWRDAFVANGHIDDYIERFEAGITYAQLPLFYRNVEGRTFQEIGKGAGFGDKMVARGCAAADYDRDGDLDVAVTENNGPFRLYRNETGSAGRWLRVALDGRGGNRAGIGARVEVRAGGLTQTAWVRAGGLYLSQNELPLHFGLGGRRPEQIALTWPGGQRQIAANPPVNETIRMQEP